MATAEELLATVGNEQNYIVIDSDLRTMTFPASVKNIGVENDKDVHKLNFMMPRYFGEYDLSTFNIRINYLNAQGDGDMYVVTDPMVEEDTIYFTWLVGRHACLYRGAVTFIVCLKLADGEGDVAQEFNTTLASLQVLPGLETEPTILENDYDIIEQLLLTVQDTNDKIKAVLDSGMTAEELGDIAKEQKTLKSRMDEFASLPDGSTAGDAELTDIRVGVDGTTYNSAGNAVRGQITDLKTDMNKLADGDIKNKIAAEVITNDVVGVSVASNGKGSFYVDGTATESGNRTINVSGNFELLAGTYTVSAKSDRNIPSCQLYVQTPPRNVITNININGASSTFTLEEKTTIFLGLYFWNEEEYDAQINAQIETGTIATEFEPSSYAYDYIARQDAEKALSIFSSTITKESINLHNSDTDVIGLLYDTGTINSSADGYKTTDYIKIYKGFKYTVLPGIRKVHAYNSDYISYEEISSTAISDFAFESPIDGYMRISYSADAPLEAIYSSFTHELTEKTFEGISFSNTQIKQVQSEISNAISGIVAKESINLYNSETDVIGVLYSNGTINSSADGYKTTEYIRVNKGLTYTVLPSSRIIHAYNLDRTSYGNISSASATNFTFESPIDGYVRVSYSLNNPLQTVSSSFADDPSEKVAEGIALSNTQMLQVKDEIADSMSGERTDILYGKKWAVCGDSFTNSGGAGTGTMPTGTKYAGKPYTYPWIIGSRRNMEIYQFFMGGRTLAFPAEPGTFENSLTNPNATWYYQNIPEDSDYITIYLGINDRNHSSGSSSDGEDTTGVIPLGTVDDTTTATYLGAWNVVLPWLITNRPNAHIGMIVTNGIAADDRYREGQIAIAQKYGIPYIDMNGDSRTPAMLRTSNPNIPSSVKSALIEKWAVDSPNNEHPNDAAQLFESTFIENFLRSI